MGEGVFFHIVFYVCRVFSFLSFHIHFCVVLTVFTLGVFFFVFFFPN